MERENGNKLKILCLHGFRTSGSFLKKQISKWDPSLFTQFHMVMNRFYFYFANVQVYSSNTFNIKPLLDISNSSFVDDGGDQLLYPIIANYNVNATGIPRW